MKQIELLETLQADKRELILAATRLLQEDNELLVQVPDENSWSVAQVIAHLNSYGRYYLPAIESSMKNSPPPTGLFKPGLLGDYFTKLMKPGTKKMQSPKDHRPAPAMQSRPVIDEFLLQGQWMLELLEKAKSANIGKTRVPISLAKFIKLKLGDTFRFVIAHEQRHFVQIEKILSHEHVQQAIG